MASTKERTLSGWLSSVGMAFDCTDHADESLNGPDPINALSVQVENIEPLPIEKALDALTYIEVEHFGLE